MPFSFQEWPFPRLLYLQFASPLHQHSLLPASRSLLKHLPSSGTTDSSQVELGELKTFFYSLLNKTNRNFDLKCRSQKKNCMCKVHVSATSTWLKCDICSVQESSFMPLLPSLRTYSLLNNHQLLLVLLGFELHLDGISICVSGFSANIIAMRC